jgi:hypothetical protein
MKIARLKVVGSSTSPEWRSLRGPKGRRHGDPCQPHVTDAGFEPGDDVVLILASDFEKLTKEGA